MLTHLKSLYPDLIPLLRSLPDEIAGLRVQGTLNLADNNLVALPSSIAGIHTPNPVNLERNDFYPTPWCESPPGVELLFDAPLARTCSIEDY